MFETRRAPTAALAVLFGIAYFALAEAGHWLAEPINGGALATVWPPSGLYVAALYLARRRAGWFVLSACLAYLSHDVLIHDRSLWTSLAFFLADTGEAALGAWGLFNIC